MGQFTKLDHDHICGWVLLFDEDKSRISYLKSILEFVDYSLLVSSDINDLAEKLQTDVDYIAVMLAPNITDEECRQLVELLEDMEHAPALLIVHEEKDPWNKCSYLTSVLAEITLPTSYSILLNALSQAQLYIENQASGENTKRRLELFRSSSGNSRATRQTNRLIEQVADSEATVLILGESGTGKEVVARKLHFHSNRRGKPFVPVNCGAIPADLLESELFGHEKGAFTGAINSRQGRFEMAEGGTLFLDEIGDMSISMQVKILRVLQERSFERVGSNKTINCCVRIIAATHRNLEQLIEQDKFREDLYYRLNVFPIEVAPLRERVADVAVLVTDLISRIETEKRGSVRLTPAAVAALSQYQWPGNVRELANLIERLAILYPYGVVDVKELPEKFREGIELPRIDGDHNLPLVTVHGDEPGTIQSVPRLPKDGIDLKAHLGDMELSLIKQALDESGGVVAHAAKSLKMRRTTLVEKLRKYGIQRG
ncbi:MAG: sigma-54-dependent Fis family transcriptional regulator [Gammaproteobacteria bacterium]|nr:sigma-54-dependent Fis family transcriptional regulator [Gammaproteobacteria bacterium]